MRFYNNKLTDRDLASFTRQLATMQTAGIPLLRALQIMRSNNHKPTIKSLLNNLQHSITTGHTFANSLANEENFDALFVNLVAIGESSGKLDVILQNLADYTEQAAKFKAKIAGAMWYPAIVLLVTITISCILLLKVVPTFKNIFDGLGIALPAATMFILNLSRKLQHHRYILLIFCIIAGLLIRYYRNSIMPKAPIIGAIIRKIQVARFSRSLGIAIAAGIPLQQAIRILVKLSNSAQYQKAILLMHNNIASGQSVHMAMQATKLFSAMVIQMVAIGEESASLDAMFQKVASIYEEELELAMEQVSVLLEPLLIIVLGFIIGGLIVAMYMPIFNLGTVI